MPPKLQFQQTEKLFLTKTAQPFIKWVGGKRSLLSQIQAFIPATIGNYFEPFIGGGAIFFALYEQIKHATLVDNNLALVITYQVIKKEPEALIAKLKEYEKKHSEEHYYLVRKKKPTNPIDIAARFLYLNKTCFNGLYRVNKSGDFNVPIGSYTNPNIVQEENLLACHKALQGVNILFGDFTKIEPQRGDFVYFDPPYHPTNELSFTEYTKENFTEKDQVRLRDFIVELHRKGVLIILSNSDTKLIQDIYRASYFHQYVVMAPRFVNCKPNERDKVRELLITNY